MLDLTAASHAPTVAKAAVAYFYAGVSVIPLQGKQPGIRWERYQQERAVPDLVHKWKSLGKLENVGIVLGNVSKGLVVIDLDTPAAVQEFEARWPRLLDTFSVTTSRGKHYYYQCAMVPPNRKVGPFELRGGGQYVVAAPSLHPSGVRYAPGPQGVVMQVELNAVYGWLLRMAERERAVTDTAFKSFPPGGPDGVTKVVPAGIRNPKAWAAAAMRREAEAVRGAAEGNRNDALNRAAYKLGQLVGWGWLTRGEVQQALWRAATGLVASDGERAVIATITSGLNSGMRGEIWRSK